MAGPPSGMQGNRVPKGLSIARVRIDPHSFPVRGGLSRSVDAAIADLLAYCRMDLPGVSGGSFQLNVAVAGDRLVMDLTREGKPEAGEPGDGQPVARLRLPTRSMRRLVKDYLDVCAAHAAAIQSGNRGAVESIDMGRRGLHDEGAEALRDQLAPAAEIDHETARRLFGLVAALHRIS